MATEEETIKRKRAMDGDGIMGSSIPEGTPWDSLGSSGGADILPPTSGLQPPPYQRDTGYAKRFKVGEGGENKIQ